MERVDSFKYLDVHITVGLTWALHTDSVVRKARQRLFHLRHLRKFQVSPQILRNFCSCTIENILMGNITVWYGNSTEQDRKTLQRGVALPCLKDIYTRRYKNKARRIIKDPNHPDNGLFSLLWSHSFFNVISGRQSAES